MNIACENQLLDWRPDHAYVPGVNERHADQLFDPLKAYIPEEISFEVLDHCLLYKLGLSFAAEGFFWECHEVFEPLWLTASQGSSEKLHLQALIQLANAGLKYRMERANAVQRLRDMANDLQQQAQAANDVPQYAIANFENLQAQLPKED